MDQIETYLLRAIKTLGASLLGKPIQTTVLVAFMAELQEIETVLFDILARYTIDGADRPRLEVLGRIVGQKPRGYSDDTLRRAIRARIGANQSSGTAANVLNVIHLLFDDPLATMFQRQQDFSTMLVVITTSPPPDGAREALQEIGPLTRLGGHRLTVLSKPTGEMWITGHGNDAPWASGVIWYTGQGL